MADIQDKSQVQNITTPRFGGTYLTPELIQQANEQGMILPPFQKQTLTEPVQRNNNVNWFDSWATKPMSSEEQQKRAKAANTINMLGHLGMAFAGLGNVLATGKGAKATQIPTVPDTNISAYRDKWKGEEQEYLKGRMTAQKADRDEYLNQLKLYVQDKANVDKVNNYLVGQFTKSVNDVIRDEKKANYAKDLENTKQENRKEIVRLTNQGKVKAASLRGSKTKPQTYNGLTEAEIAEAVKYGVLLYQKDEITGMQRARPASQIISEIQSKRKRQNKK